MFSKRTVVLKAPDDCASRKRGMTVALRLPNRTESDSLRRGGHAAEQEGRRRDRERVRRSREAKLGLAPPLAHLDNDSTPRRCHLCCECRAVGRTVGWTNPRARCPRSASRRGGRAASAPPSAHVPEPGRSHSSISQGSIGRARGTSHAAARSKERHLLAPDRGVFAPVGKGGETGAAPREPCPTTRTVSSGVARCSPGRAS